MSLRNFLRIAPPMCPLEMVRALENLVDQALSLCGFAPATHREAKRGREQARLWQMQQSLRTWTQIRCGSDCDGAGGSGDRYDREPGGARSVCAKANDRAIRSEISE